MLDSHLLDSGQLDEGPVSAVVVIAPDPERSTIVEQDVPDPLRSTIEDAA